MKLVFCGTPQFAVPTLQALIAAGHEIALVGIRKGEVAGHPIVNDKTPVKDVDTVTLYVGPQNQPEWYDYILNLRPRRIVFNPGTENPELERLANKQGIQTLQACTLVMLAANSY